MSILKLDYQGLPVHADREAWFNATEIAAMFGRRPIDWLRLPEGDVFEPVESREQAKCVCCRLKGGRMLDYQVSKRD